ncbi:MAG: SPOR domain-containing protein [Syntrophobacterales bacterium]|nr:MAG: SPOR domain-containing protein [Syntrophobacterales bacterium]
MNDGNYERPERNDSEEVPVFSDRELEDYLKVEEEYSKRGEMTMKGNPSPQILASLKRQRRSRRSLLFVVLLCFVLGIFVLAVFFVMKPEVRKPQIVAKKMKRPIRSVEREEESTVPEVVGKKVGEEQLSEGGIPEEKEPIGSKLPETPLINRERGQEKKVVVIEGMELPKGKEGEKVAEAEEKGASIERGRESKPKFAKAEEPKVRTIPEQKLPIGRYTINVGSFRERVKAERLMKELKEKGYKAFVAEAAIPKKGTWYRVSIGRFPSRGEATVFARALKKKEGMDSFVRELKETKR